MVVSQELIVITVCAKTGKLSNTIKRQQIVLSNVDCILF